MNPILSEQDFASAVSQQPYAVLVGVFNDVDPNHKVAFVNQAFTDIYGYNVADIPDKCSWWERAYPDPEYRKVVERQWELLVAEHLLDDSIPIEMDINITTKSGIIVRSTVTAESPGETFPGHYIVTFKPC